jgi:hypothetical protein
MSEQRPEQAELAEHFVLRVAGLPATALEPLRAPHTAAWADQALTDECRLATLAPTAEDALARAVGRTGAAPGTAPGTGSGSCSGDGAGGARDETRLRRRLLALRRDVHNGRSPGDPHAAELAAELPPEDRVPVREWLELRRRYDDGLAAADDTAARELAASRDHLRTLADDPVLRAGIQSASPSLAAMLPAYADGGTRLSTKRRRAVERSVLSYVHRAAVKTSPFSTLTTVAYGRFADGAAAPLTLTGTGLPADPDPDPGPGTGLPADPDPDPDPGTGTGTGTDPGHLLSAYGMRRTARFRPNLTAVHHLLTAALDSSAARATLPVCVTPGLRRDGERVRYIRRRYRLVAPDTPLAAPGVLAEKPYELTARPVLTEVLDLLDGERGLPLGELAERLHQADPEGRPRRQLDDYLSRLIDLGLLVSPPLSLDIHHPDPVADAAERLRALGPEWAGRLGDRLATIADLAAAHPLAPHSERARVTAELRTEYAEAQRELGRSEPNVARTAGYEDTVPADSAAAAARTAWEAGVLPALRRFARILPAFDLMLADRLLVRGHFRARYGPGGVCRDIAGFARDLYDSCGKWLTDTGTSLGRLGADGRYEPRPNPYGLPEVAALDDTHHAFARALRDAVRETPQGTDVELSETVLDQVAALLPDLGESLPSSRGCYLQWAQPADGPPLAVLNWTYAGMGQPVARFARSFGPDAEAELVAAVRRRHEGLLPPGAVFADLGGGYDTSNLALRPPFAPYRISGPGETGHGPPEQRLPVADLTLTDDEESGELRLHSRRLGCRVIPLHLGGLVPMALPAVQRTLLALSPAAMPISGIWAALADAPRHKPRVRHGDLVLARRSWQFPRAELAGLSPSAAGADTARGFLERRRWWRAAGLPTRVVARTGTADAGGAAHKPLPVDADSPLSLALLDHRLGGSTTERADGAGDADGAGGAGDKGGGEPVFTELLPDLGELPLHVGGFPYVSELCLELDGC